MILRFACVAVVASLSQGRVHHEPAFVTLGGTGWGCQWRKGCTAVAATTPRAERSSSPRPPLSDQRISSHSSRRSRSNRRKTNVMVASNNKASLQQAAEPTRAASPLPALDSPAGAALAAEGISQKEWEALLEAGEVASLEEGKLIMSQGDTYEHPGDRELYLLLRGELQIEVQGKPVGRIGTGDFVGEASFSSRRPAPRTATVRAKTDHATVVAWTWDGLGEFMGDPKNLRTKAALQAVWMAGLASKLNDVMSALGGQSVIKDAEKDNVRAGDYGFRYLEDTREVDSIVPISAFTLAWWTFTREYRALRRTFRFGEFKDTGIAVPFSVIDRFLETSVFPVLRPSRVDLPRDPEVTDLQKRLSGLKLSNKAIEDREIARIASTKAFLEEEARKGIKDAGNILRSQTPWFVMVPYKVLCWFLDVVFEDRPIQRFWFLETVARMPYFSYLSMLFLFETLGWWSGGAEVRKVHFAEEYNELQHLRIMESLGGDIRWSDRFLARHASLVYFAVLTLGYLVSPFLAYNFSELIESHAVDTYTEFTEANEELLKSLPPTPQALNYYHGGDMYLFDEFQTSRPAFSRRPVIKNLYDVFSSIRDDEMEHVKTMFACERGKGSLTSPNAAAATPRWAEDATTGPPPMSSATAANIRRNKANRDNNGDDTGSERDFEAGGGAWGENLDGSLRTDIVQKTPLETFTAAFDPLRDLIDEAEKSGIAKKLRSSSSPPVVHGEQGEGAKEDEAGSGTGSGRINVSDFEESEAESSSESQHGEKR